MRVTNKMMTNNMLNNINDNKNRLSKLEDQRSTGKKIQRPSDDPIIAVRALKLRTSVAELEQYYNKNIPDAQSWMDVTESALRTINGILTSVNTYCNQGANDVLTTEDRKSIMEDLIELKQQIYQEGNASYAGRYVFSGYKTDTSLIFDKSSSDTKYAITEHLTGADIDTISYVTGGYDLTDYDPESPDSTVFADAPNKKEAYRLRLSYDNLDPEDIEDGLIVRFNGEDAEDEGTEDSFSVTIVSSNDEGIYEPEGDDIYLIAETGELILGSGAYEFMRTADDIEITYGKTNFERGDLRPENYFDCTAIALDEEGEEVEDSMINYSQSKYNNSQDIEYEVGFSQKLKVNTMGKDAIKHAIGRDIDEIVSVINDVDEVENRLAEVDKLLADSQITTEQKTALTAMKEQLETERVLKTKMMQEKFSSGLDHSSAQQDVLNVAVADLGSRQVRLQLTQSRLLDQKDNFTDLLSNNEDVDIVDAIINYSAQEVVYNAALSSASKVVKNTLIDFV